MSFGVSPVIVSGFLHCALCLPISRPVEFFSFLTSMTSDRVFAVFIMCDRILNIDRKEERRINFILMDSGRRKMRSRSDNCEALTGTLYMRHLSHIHKNLKSLQINEVFSLANSTPPIVLWDFAIVCFMFLDSFESYPQVCGLLVT